MGNPGASSPFEESHDKPLDLGLFISFPFFAHEFSHKSIQIARYADPFSLGGILYVVNL